MSVLFSIYLICVQRSISAFIRTIPRAVTFTLKFFSADNALLYHIITSVLKKKKAETESQPGPQCRMASGNSVAYSISKKNCNYNRLQESLIDNLVICPMDIQGFAVNYEFGHFWKVFRNFPVYVIPGKSRYGLS